MTRVRQGAGKADLKGKSHRPVKEKFLTRIASKNGLGEGVPKTIKRGEDLNPREEGSNVFRGGGHQCLE
jgi:hypothetical protein